MAETILKPNWSEYWIVRYKQDSFILGENNTILFTINWLIWKKIWWLLKMEHEIQKAGLRNTDWNIDCHDTLLYLIDQSRNRVLKIDNKRTELDKLNRQKRLIPIDPNNPIFPIYIQIKNNWYILLHSLLVIWIDWLWRYICIEKQWKNHPFRLISFDTAYRNYNWMSTFATSIPDLKHFFHNR